MEEERLITLFTQSTGKSVRTIEKIHGSGGGGRCYYHITDTEGGSMFGIKGTNPEENTAFYELSRLFYASGFHTPQVYGITEDRMYYLQQYLGTTTLADFLKAHKDSDGNYDSEASDMALRAIADLPKMQFEGASRAAFDNCYPVPSMDEMSIMFDLNYFKYCFLKLRNIEFNEVRLETDYRYLTSDILAEMTDTFMYRDFQSRNVMIHEGTPYYIDYQGGRKGPIYYDVASFVWQASANYPDQFKSRLIDAYIQALQPYMQISREKFLPKLRLFVLFRTLQVLGAYGFRGLWEKKQQFIDSIPQGLRNLRKLLDSGVCNPYPELKSACKALVESASQDDRDSQRHGIRVMSFSYKKGIPADHSGNGGGYVFDCRSTHNPGRYEQYRHLTGLDQPVIDFLEENGEILTFLDSVYKIVDFHVQRYLERGFTDLLICFGCTGGQHRSVYSAQHVAEHIHEKFGIPVHLTHREQGIDSTL